jgi:hypothetical protein
MSIKIIDEDRGRTKGNWGDVFVVCTWIGLLCGFILLVYKYLMK